MELEELKTLNDADYNLEIDKFSVYERKDFRNLNYRVMSHTLYKCENDSEIVEVINKTKSKQFIIYDKDYDGSTNKINLDGPTTNVVISQKRTYEAASSYKGKKIAVLNFANNHNVGGSPFYAGAQEESLCRTSSLYPCILNEEKTFYKYHTKLYEQGKLDNRGNGDLIYSPNVLVFKSDESAPKMLNSEDRFFVDIITLAAPQFSSVKEAGNFYKEKIKPRLRKVFEVAKENRVEVLILGAWGCGAFHNPTQEVAEVFKELCSEYKFDTIEFAIYCRNYETKNYEIFKRVFEEE